MTCVAPRFTFNLSADRFDTVVREAFPPGKVTRHQRDQLISQVREGRWDHLLLKRLPGLETLPRDINESAAINIIDFQFEQTVLQGMGREQLVAYLKSFDKVIRIDSVQGLGNVGPLWIDSLHHVCVFSVLYDFAEFLLREQGFTECILLHQGARPEPRLALVDQALRRTLGKGVRFIHLNGNWMSTLSKVVTPNAAIFHFADLPNDPSRRPGPTEDDTAALQLHAPPNISAKIKILSGSDEFARHVGAAAHVVLDYPKPDRIQVRPYDAANPVSFCPLEDWVFWPNLTASSPHC